MEYGLEAGSIANWVVSSGANVDAGPPVAASVTIATDGVLLTELTGNTTDASAKSDRLAVDGDLTMTGAEIQLDWLAVDAVEDGDYPTTEEDEAARAIAKTSKFGGAYTIATATGSLAGTPTVATKEVGGITIAAGNIGENYVASVDNTAGVLTVTLYDLADGDVTLNGSVDSRDLALFGANWASRTGNTWADGDFNFDGSVDSRDLALLGAKWAWRTPGYVEPTATGAIAGTSSSPVPEPGTIIMLLIGAAGLLLYRKRR